MKPYVTAGKRAEEVTAANPDMGNRAIAEKIGVSKDTVRRARKAVGAKAPTEKRTGKDGKAARWFVGRVGAARGAVGANIAPTPAT
jgi:hypothetical protein